MEIKNNDGNYWIKSKEVEGLYHELSMEMMKDIVRRLKQRGTADLIDNPYVWQLEKLNDLHLITEENVKLISKYSGVAEEVFRDVIANEGFKIYQDSHKQLAQALKSDATPNPMVQDSLNSLAKQTMFEVNNLINTTMPKALQKNYKQTLESAVAGVVSGTKSHEKALSEAVLKMYERGFTAFRDRGGKTWTVERYAQTVIRTTTFRVYREMRERPSDDLGIDTYYYSAKSSARELCAPLQHQIVTKGVARTINGERVLSLPDYGYGSPGGCLGINCGHYLTPFVVGVNYKPQLPEYLQNLTEGEVKQNALDRARLKAFDREIRINRDKQKLLTNLNNKEELQKLKIKEKTLLSGRKSLIEKNPTVVGKYPAKRVEDKPKKVYNKGIDIKIDKFTNCLEDKKTGKEINTEIKPYKPKLKDLQGWKFDWTKEKDSNISALYLENDKVIQGLIATRLDSNSNAVYVKLVETAPHNYGKNGEYAGVGAHLFAHACKEAKDNNFNAVYFDSKTKLKDHYAKTLGATVLFGDRMIIEHEAFNYLIKKYYKE